MSNLMQRAYPRTAFHVPIQYSLLNSQQFHQTRMHNFSAGGLCYETDRQLDPEAEVCIVMKNYTPGQYGPEAFRSYVAKTRWVQPLTSNGHALFTIGAQIIARSHEILSSEAGEPRQICDLCGVLMPADSLQATADEAYLCIQCNKYFQRLPKGKVRECLERFLVGNVI